MHLGVESASVLQGELQPQVMPEQAVSLPTQPEACPEPEAQNQSKEPPASGAGKIFERVESITSCLMPYSDLCNFLNSPLQASTGVVLQLGLLY